MDLRQFFSKEAGQARSRALNSAISEMIPPNLRPLVGLLAEAAPTTNAANAMVSGGLLASGDLTPMQAVGEAGKMASNIAGVVAPAWAASKVGAPAVTALQEGLLGVSAPYRQGAQAWMADESGAIKAFHGSPHDFDKFSMSKIGTGEGAQAYGHGLYFAENEGVARGYRDALSLDAGFSYKGREGMTREQLAEAIAAEYGGKYLDNIITPRGVADAVMDELVYGPSQRKLGPERAALRENLLSEIQRTDPGRMYEVNINANPEDFLDWDKPLSEQPSVLSRLGFSNMDEDAIHAEALRIMEAKPNGAWMNDPASKARIDELQGMLDRIAPSGTGQDFYRGGSSDDVAGILSQMGYGDPAAQSQALREAGIPGIKYLDAGSRGAGDGSRNYVVFDENLIEIVRKYGIAGAAALLGVSAMDVEQAMAQGSQPQGLLAGGPQ